MDGGNEQRVAITFCFKAGLSEVETLVLVQKAYGNEALNRSNFLKWYSRFRDGRELVEDEERCGCPKVTRTEVNIIAVVDVVKNNRRIALTLRRLMSYIYGAPILDVSRSRTTTQHSR